MEQVATQPQMKYIKIFEESLHQFNVQFTGRTKKGFWQQAVIV